MFNAPIDASSSLDAVYDGLHGYISLDDMWSKADGDIKRLLNAPYLQRLRRVKQLGFVSQSFLSAEHNRYAHALGTMHMMRDLLTQLTKHGSSPDSFWIRIIEDVARVYPFIKSIKTQAVKRDALFQHVLVAALLQDVGEYPYAKATEFFFRPMTTVKTFLQKKFNFDVANMTNKALMTLSVIFDELARDYIKELNPEFLAFLLTGVLPAGVEQPSGLKILRHLLDGAIDADRLDYVYRDMYHTLGERSIATPIVDSILTYDAQGPVLRHVRPITEFLSKRALLWSSVYHAPENRFRIILLRAIFKEYSTRLETAEKVFGEKKPFSVNSTSFLDFDDRWVEHKIHTLDINTKNDCSPNVTKAAKFLSSRNSEYEYRWVAMDSMKDCNLNREDVLPNFFYFDRYSDYFSHSLYDRKSIRIRGNRYGTGSGAADVGTVDLEECVGPFSAALQAPWPSLPMPGFMAWFQPSDPKGRTDKRWERLKRFQQGADDPVLHGQFILNDPMLDGDVGFDTRDDDDPPDIFISFRWDDYKTVYRIAEVLRKLHVRYFNLGGDYIGSGATIATNSRNAVAQADAVIILYSEGYAKRYRELPANGAISAEVAEMIRRKATDNLPIVVLSMEPFSELENKLPWAELGFEGGAVPAARVPLRSATDEQLQGVVIDAVGQIRRSVKIKLKAKSASAARKRK